MRNITIRDILKITNGYLQGNVDESYREDLLSKEIRDIAIDSREVEDGLLFVAFKGEKVDAHKFLPDVALKCDAMLIEESEEDIKALIDGKELPDNKAYIRVDSTLDSLQKIAAYIRMFYDKPVVGVTGSVGKTTTREMITHTLSSSLEVFHTKGNMNSQIGVPLTISHILDEKSDAAVLEMGISENGGMNKLVNMVRPDIAVCTMIGVAHIEFMKTKQGIMEEKLHIAAQMDENGALFVNADDEYLSKVEAGFSFDDGSKLKCKVFKFGTVDNADFRAENIRLENGYNTYTYVHGDTRIDVNLHQPGIHNVLNSLVSMAIADYLGLDLMKAAASFESFEGLRQRIIESDKGYTVIDDAYNASPDSMKAAINVLSDAECSGRKIAVLGDMFELGTGSDDFHSEVGEYIYKKYKEDMDSLDELICIGKSSVFYSTKLDATDVIVHQFENNEEAADYLKGILSPGDIVLLKASNGMHFTEIVKELV